MLSPSRLQSCYASVRAALLAEKGDASHWTGELSTSALSTAVAVMALQQIHRSGSSPDPDRDAELMRRGLAWLVQHQNDDGGWGDTVKSHSNISTTMLSQATLVATGEHERSPETSRRAQTYINDAGGVPAIVARYGKDKTFSVPILTHAALAGLVDWSDVQALPFELAALPPSFYAAIRLPVVSYALPALIAIGQVRHHHRPSWNPVVRATRAAAVRPTLRRLTGLQPENGGFLEAVPLTAFVTMSLAGMGRATHPVAIKGREFIVNSVREDGSWPIDTDLATWVTTLSINALQDDVPIADREPLSRWLLNQQYREVHPFTQAKPGGWAWTDLPGGVPDADDTPGAILALLELHEGEPASEEVGLAIIDGIRWLLGLQNRDGGWPTFCRGWGTLPFDRSNPDLSAHAIRALRRATASPLLEAIAEAGHIDHEFYKRVWKAVDRGVKFLLRVQRPDGSWIPLWFGNQDVPDEENPTYGTARVLMALSRLHTDMRIEESAIKRGSAWLREHQNDDGGWGGGFGTVSTIEETSLAVEALLTETLPATEADNRAAADRGLRWLCDRIDDETAFDPSPIGFYFAKLWYFERLYPMIFLASTLRLATRR